MTPIDTKSMVRVGGVQGWQKILNITLKNTNYVPSIDARMFFTDRGICASHT